MTDQTDPNTAKELKTLHKNVAATNGRIDVMTGRIDVMNEKFDKLAVVVTKNTHDIAEIKETMATKMATKQDVSLILDRIDHFTKKVDVFDKKVLVHDYRLNQAEPKIEDHGKRLAVLESRRPSR